MKFIINKYVLSVVAYFVAGYLVNKIVNSVFRRIGL